MLVLSVDDVAHIYGDTILCFLFLLCCFCCYVIVCIHLLVVVVLFLRHAVRLSASRLSLSTLSQGDNSYHLEQGVTSCGEEKVKFIEGTLTTTDCLPWIRD